MKRQKAMMRRTALILAATTLSLACGCVHKQYLKAAQERAQQGKEAAAVYYLSEALREKPDYEDAARFLPQLAQKVYSTGLAAAKDYERRKKFGKAVAEYDRLAVLAQYITAAPGGASLKAGVAERRQAAVRSAVEKWYSEGRKLEKRGKMMDAAAAYRKSMAFDSGYRDVSQRYELAKAAGTKRISILADDKTRKESEIANMLAEEVVSKAMDANPEFLEFVDRSRTEDLLKEQAFTLSGAVNAETLQAGGILGKIKGVYAFVFVKLDRVTRKEGRWRDSPMRNQIRIPIYRKDPRTGKQIHVGDETVTFRWVRHKKTNRASVAATYEIVEVATGKVVAKKHVQKRVEDHALYDDSFSGDERASPGVAGSAGAQLAGALLGGVTGLLTGSTENARETAKAISEEGLHPDMTEPATVDDLVEKCVKQAAGDLSEALLAKYFKQ